MKKSTGTFLKQAAHDKINRSANPAIVRASTILFKTVQELRNHQKQVNKNKKIDFWDYGRQGSQTTIQLQEILKKLEGAHHVFLTQTGFGSVALALMSICRPGDEIIVSDCVYRPTQELTSSMLKEFNVKTLWYDPNNLDDLKKKITKRTKLILLNFKILEKYCLLQKKIIYTQLLTTLGEQHFF